MHACILRTYLTRQTCPVSDLASELELICLVWLDTNKASIYLSALLYRLLSASDGQDLAILLSIPQWPSAPQTDPVIVSHITLLDPDEWD